MWLRENRQKLASFGETSFNGNQLPSRNRPVKQFAPLIKLIPTLAVVLTFSACATQLAPPYDKALVDGMASTNKEVMSLFATASGGTSQGSFDTRAASYNKAIGGVDALEIQAKARPLPKTKVTEIANKYLTQRGLPALTDDQIPSATALHKVSETITKMRDTDRKQGLTGMEVRAFKGQAAVYLDQAITYESFLER